MRLYIILFILISIFTVSIYQDCEDENPCTIKDTYVPNNIPLKKKNNNLIDILVLLFFLFMDIVTSYLFISIALLYSLLYINNHIWNQETIIRTRKKNYIPKCEDVTLDNRNEKKCCPICFQNKIILSAMPCKHLGYCRACALVTIENKKCYYCQKDINYFETQNKYFKPY